MGCLGVLLIKKNVLIKSMDAASLYNMASSFKTFVADVVFSLAKCSIYFDDAICYSKFRLVYLFEYTLQKAAQTFTQKE